VYPVASVAPTHPGAASTQLLPVDNDHWHVLAAFSEGEASVKLESWHNSEDKRRWKIVRTDNYTDIAGEIVTADETTGECSIHVGGETKTLSFGPGGIRIVGRAR
jgi:hypothetical protein